MSEESMPEPQYDAHVDARKLHKNVDRAESAIKAAKLKGKDLKAAGQILEAYKTGNLTAGTIEAFAQLSESAAKLPAVQSVLQTIYAVDVKLAMLNPRTRQIAKAAESWTDDEFIALLDKKHDGLVNAATRGAAAAVNSNPLTKMAFTPLRMTRGAYRAARTAVGVIPGLEQDPDNWDLETLQYALIAGIVPASDAVIEHAISKLPGESGVRSALAKGISLAALAKPEAGLIAAGMKLEDTAETAKVRALLAVRAERMAEAESETIVIELAAEEEEELMHAADLPTDAEAANNNKEFNKAA